MQCLQQSIVEPVLEQGPHDITCANVTEIAYSTHTKCYVDSGLCDLSFWDKMQIYNVVDYSDVFSWRGMSLSIEMDLICKGWMKSPSGSRGKS